MQAQPVMMAAPQPQYVQAAAPISRTPRVYEKYAVKQAHVLGALQVCIGILSIIFQIVGIVVYSDGAYVGVGIWCGILFVIAGGLGLGSAKNRSLGMIVATMVMSIVAAIFCIAQLIYGSVAYSQDRRYEEYGRYYYFGYYSSYSNSNQISPHDVDANWGARKAMSVLLLVLALAEAVVSIWQSALCCSACCCSTTPGRTLAPVQYQVVGPGQQMVVIQPGQQGVFYQQTGTQPYPTQGYPMQPGVHAQGPGTTGPQQGYTPQQGYVPQQGYAPPQGYAPQQTTGYAPPPQLPMAGAGNPPPYVPEDELPRGAYGRGDVSGNASAPNQDGLVTGTDLPSNKI